VRPMHSHRLDRRCSAPSGAGDKCLAHPRHVGFGHLPQASPSLAERERLRRHGPRPDRVGLKRGAALPGFCRRPLRRNATGWMPNLARPCAPAWASDSSQGGFRLSRNKPEAAMCVRPVALTWGFHHHQRGARVGRIRDASVPSLAQRRRAVLAHRRNHDRWAISGPAHPIGR